MAIIKSNAYGHGLLAIANLLSARSKKLWFGVDSITEALTVRREKIANPILVLGYTLPARLREAADKNISVAISNFDGLMALVKLKTKPAFHVKVETGMNRLGFPIGDLGRLVKILKKFNLAPEGIYSHLAEPPDLSYSIKQIGLFRKALSIFESAALAPKFRHLAKTEWILFYPEIKFDLVRLGIGLYGYFPARNLKLRPVMAWKTVVAEVKNVTRGERIGYGLTERFRRDSKIAVLPVGYWHGYDRKLSSIGEVLIHGRRAKVMGRVCMDMTMVDLAKIRNVKIGDEAVLLGKQGREEISGHEIADKVGTTVYEIITRINPLIYKIVV